MRWVPASLLTVLAVVAIACHGETTTGSTPSPDAPVDSWPPPQDRPYEVYLPQGLAEGEAAPLLVVLHGYGLDAAWEADYLLLHEVADAAGMLLVLPNGVPDASGKRFWNGTDCCLIDGEHVDDVGYLAAVIAQMQARYDVDAARVFVIGHSSGAFMAHRLACERGELLTGIVSLAGGQWLDAADCPAGPPVSVLQIHGTADAIVWYAGGATYPGAIETANRWLARNGCPDALAMDGALDLDALLLGDETTIATSSGCDEATMVELWSIVGGAHVPTLKADVWIAALLEFLARA
ncbi:MAG: hypothetical protein IPL79_11845 [Myxococcales bacterium]|nr:hypothetical protein [Myxococcales bacterium]